MQQEKTQFIEKTEQFLIQNTLLIIIKIFKSMLNEIRLIGRLGADPEIRQTTGGKDVASLSVSTWESWFNKDKGPAGEFETQTEWHKVIAWGDQVKQRISKLRNGDLVLVTGASKTRKFTDAQGIDRWTTEVVGQVKPMPNPHGNESTINRNV